MNEPSEGDRIAAAAYRYGMNDEEAENQSQMRGRHEETLARIRHRRFTPPSGTPTAEELIREDRSR